MTIKTILVCLTTTTNAERLSKAASYLAQKFHARIIGLHTLQSIEIYPSIAVDLPSLATDAFVEDQNKQADEIRATFEKVTTSHGLNGEWRQVPANSSFAADRMIEHAHSVDLVIMGQEDQEHDRPDQRSAQEMLIKQSGRPVLIIPLAGTFDTIGEHALMGWSATRESSRAMHDAIPLLSGGVNSTNGKATILWVSHNDSDGAYLENTAHAMAATLDRHGISTSVAHWQNTKISIADALLNEASDRGADLIVTGAYGHSKFYDFVIGATTTGLLDHMTVPVLFSN